MEIRIGPALRIGRVEENSTPPPASEHILTHDRQAADRDWYFEPNRRLRGLAPINRLVGESPAMMDLRRRVALYAATDETVLISGETGTGKELIARLLHELSSRCSAPFVAVNCAAIPSPLAESELFGCTRGAFTGAVQCRSGLFAKASGGTLFLDEFGELAPEIQSKFLRALELGVYRPVGASREQHADVRIIAATNRDLEAAVSRGEFRADLYYRVNVLQIFALPLRKHRGDIPQIVDAIFGELLPEGMTVRVTESAMAELLRAAWPGNVRELKNVLRRSLVMSSQGVIERIESDLDSRHQGSTAARDEALSTGNLLSALTRNRGRLGEVAHDLDVSVRTIQRRMKGSGLRLKDFRSI